MRVAKASFWHAHPICRIPAKQSLEKGKTTLLPFSLNLPKGLRKG